MTKIAAITGAASGIGRGTAKRLLDEGWTVVALDRDEAGLGALRKDLAAPADRLHVQTCDVASVESVTSAFADIGRRFGRLNGLVCSAGVLRIGTLDSMAVEDFDQLFAVNLRGLWLSAREAMPLLKLARAQGELARVVFLASIAGIRHKIDSGAYAATKAAVNSMTASLGVELKDDKIRVVGIAPGMMGSEKALDTMPDAYTQAYSRIQVASRPGREDDIANAALFLASDKAGFIAGQTLLIDGGFMMNAPKMIVQ